MIDDPKDDFAQAELKKLALPDDELPELPYLAANHSGAATETQNTADQKTDNALDQSEKPLTPVERWRAGLKSAGVTESDAQRILRDIFTKGAYQETRSLYMGTLTVTFSTRPGWILDELIRAHDSCQSSDQMVHATLTSVLNLAGALTSFVVAGRKPPSLGQLTVNRDKSIEVFQQRRQFLQSLPDAVLFQLFNQLNRFDTRISAVLADGADESF